MVISKEKLKYYQEWETPPKLFELLDSIYHFDFDLAANEDNAKCKNFFTRKEDALRQNWSGLGNLFCNPPHAPSIQTDFVNKAYYESLKSTAGVICLLILLTSCTILELNIYFMIRIFCLWKRKY
ncbi:DNA N-6-adenine-methyltransferase [Enterococcus sp. 7E2_DIV0204]|uniref:DNA N-6-adenine-methyltransferase n=1 Tax=Enterococcus sp. 7E2_DIV0204 TaxID=1834188 RepID=UPI000A353080